MSPDTRAQPYNPGPPFDPECTRGYLIDIIRTRDGWMHRVDMAGATGTEMVLTPEHDGCIVADVVSEWARRHGQPFLLALDGPAGGTYAAGEGGSASNWMGSSSAGVLSGRAAPRGLLEHEVPF